MFSDHDETFIKVFLDAATKWRAERPEASEVGLRFVAVALLRISIGEAGNWSEVRADDKITEITESAMTHLRNDEPGEAARILTQKLPEIDEAESGSSDE